MIFIIANLSQFYVGQSEVDTCSQAVIVFVLCLGFTFLFDIHLQVKYFKTDNIQ